MLFRGFREICANERGLMDTEEKDYHNRNLYICIQGVSKSLYLLKEMKRVWILCRISSQFLRFGDGKIETSSGL